MYKQEDSQEHQTPNNEASHEKTLLTEEIENRIVKSFLDIIVLIALKRKSQLTGYDIMMHVHERFGTLVSSGTIYSILYSLVKKNMVSGIADGRRTGYILTEDGENYLQAFKDSRKEFSEFMAEFLNF